MTNTPFTRRSTAVHELRLTAQVIAGLPTQPHAPDQWTVTFADFGHDLLILGALPTPDPSSEAAADLFAVLHAQDLSSYEVTAPTAADAKQRARAYFAAERIGVAPWSELGLVAMPGTPVPADGGPTAWRIATQAFAARGLTPYHDDDAGNTWMVIGPDKTLPGEGVTYAVLYVYNPTSDEGGEEITIDRPLLPGDEWRIDAGDGHGNEKALTTRPIAELADCVDVIVDLLAEHRN